MAYKLVIREGATEPIVFQLYDGDDLYVLTGYTTAEIRLVPRDGSTTLTFTASDDEFAVTDGANGETTFYPAVATLDYSKRGYEVHVWITDGNGKKISFPSDRSLPIQMIEAR